jgi:hypothetical protein
LRAVPGWVASAVAVMATLAVACIGLQLFGMLFYAPKGWTIVPPIATLAMFVVAIARPRTIWLILAWLLAALTVWSYVIDSRYWLATLPEDGWDMYVVRLLPTLLFLFCFMAINIRWWKARAGIQEARTP